jgi:hypothetical protein
MKSIKISSVDELYSNHFTPNTKLECVCPICNIAHTKTFATICNRKNNYSSLSPFLCNKCLKQTVEYKQRQSECTKKYWSNIDSIKKDAFIKKCSSSARESWKDRKINNRILSHEQYVNIGKSCWTEDRRKRHSNNVSNSWKNEKIKQKRISSIKNAWSSKSEEELACFTKQIKQTKKNRYGYESYNNMSSSCSKYEFNNIKFDSSLELAYYIFLIDKKIPFEYHPNIYFLYTFEGVDHAYHPDFKVYEDIVELKGSQFLKEDGSWKDIYHHNDALVEAKHQCLLQNNVKIIYDFEMNDIINYVKSTYGKAFLKKCKCN